MPPRELTPNGRTHWGTKAKIVKQVRLMGYAEGRMSGWPLQSKNGPRRRLTITMRRKRRLDEDAKAVVYKPLIDGLVDAGVLANDSPVFLDLVVVQEIGEPRTMLQMEECA